MTLVVAHTRPRGWVDNAIRLIEADSRRCADTHLLRYPLPTSWCADADIALYPKDEFPTEAVYGPTSGPELRLVTCGGAFDRSARSYDDNVVVDAALV